MPSSRTRRAKRLMERIDSRTNERRNAWAEGGRPNTTERLTAQLAKDHEEKRTLRREIYAANPQLEGREVRRSGSDRVGARFPRCRARLARQAASQESGRRPASGGSVVTISPHNGESPVEGRALAKDAGVAARATD